MAEDLLYVQYNPYEQIEALLKAAQENIKQAEEIADEFEIEFTFSLSENAGINRYQPATTNWSESSFYGETIEEPGMWEWLPSSVYYMKGK